jgi:hypothetical protein
MNPWVAAVAQVDRVRQPLVSSVRTLKLGGISVATELRRFVGESCGPLTPTPCTSAFV